MKVYHGSYMFLHNIIPAKLKTNRLPETNINICPYQRTDCGKTSN